jgi:hypothetical protein
MMIAMLLLLKCLLIRQIITGANDMPNGWQRSFKIPDGNPNILVNWHKVFWG